MTDYHLVIISLAARSCVKAGLKRTDATLEFMAAFDEARARPEQTRPGPIVLPAIEPDDVVFPGDSVGEPDPEQSAARVGRRGITSCRPPTEEPTR